MKRPEQVKIKEKKGSIIMKKTIARLAAAALAATLAAAALPSAAFVPVYANTSASSSGESDTDMKAALTKVKQRVKIPAELTEFTYSTGKSYGIKVYDFVWRTNGSSSYREISVSIAGDIITYYRDSKVRSDYAKEPTFAKLSEEKLISKAEGYIKQLDPKISGNIKTKLSRLSLRGSTASVSFTRYVNGVEVNGNGGTVTMNKDTGELASFSANWWENAEFPSPKSAMTEKEIKAEYKKMCTLTPCYAITTDWSTRKKSAAIVYEPDFTSEIDAFTGEPSAIWEDMRKAGGTRFYGYGINEDADDDAAYDTANPASGGSDGGVSFTSEELKKIQLDKKLITPEKAFETLKKDRFAALTDDYAVASYELYSENAGRPEPLELEEDTEAGKNKTEEKFYLQISFRIKDELKNTYAGYKNINVTIDAKTGELLNMQKYSSSAKLPKLDVGEAYAAAQAAAEHYAKDMYSKCRPDGANLAEVRTWNGGYETSRRFIFNRYVNGIMVKGDYVSVTVDSAGTVTAFDVNWTEDVKFPSAKILDTSKAFDKLYTQRDFSYYYTGWITKDGKVKVYLLYQMGSFYLNAKTGKLCTWSGGEPYSYSNGQDVNYTDIKGIPQEQAILTLQKYGVTVTSESRFKPEEVITREEFIRLTNSLGGGYYDDVDIAEDEDTVKKPVPLTRTEAAVIFSGRFDNGDMLKLKGIYKTPFSDVKSSDPNIGYIAVACAKGFIPKGDGKFRGKSTVTRAEAVQMLYDYIKSNKK